MLQEFIYHVVPAERWSQTAENSNYEPDSLFIEGFIHFSFFDQVDGVIKRYYRILDDLLVLKVELSKIQSEIKIEKVPGNGSFPHLYGMLNLDAVVGVYKIECDQNGNYYWVEK
jgi:uncharacterized protein (DUF952 family)